MTYVVTETCIRCKYMDCVEVCPVDCFYVGANMLVIHPDECIDCGVCEPECPVEAIIPDTDGEAEKWLELNRDYSEKWPNITRKGRCPTMPTRTRTRRASSRNISTRRRAKLRAPTVFPPVGTARPIQSKGCYPFALCGIFTPIMM